MDVLTQTLNSFSTQISDLEVSLNTDIFETNVINITILAGGLFYLLSGALTESLSERQQKILGAIQESEERLEEATTRLTESETQVSASSDGNRVNSKRLRTNSSASKKLNSY